MKRVNQNADDKDRRETILMLFRLGYSVEFIANRLSIEVLVIKDFIKNSGLSRYLIQ